MISPGTLSHFFPRTNFKERFLCHPDCQECALIDLGVTTVATDTLSTDNAFIEVSSQQPVLFLWDECLAGCKNGCSSSGAMVSLFSKEIFSEHWKSLPAIEDKAFYRHLPHFDRDANKNGNLNLKDRNPGMAKLSQRMKQWPMPQPVFSLASFKRKHHLQITQYTLSVFMIPHTQCNGET